MQRNNRPEAKDEVIGHAFKRSVIGVAILAVLVIAVVLARKALQEDAVLIEAPVASPVLAVSEVQAPTVKFTDVTSQSGISFSHNTGAFGDKLLPETMGSGAAFFDYDNDGNQDLLLVNSDDWPDQHVAPANQATMKLYKNDGKGRFTDVTEAAGLGCQCCS